ncbi:hypothetical protein CCYS_05085 [Corynebacterium cystitidis DSM 20524]|uniref:Uncharacterized protein n=1 Tax=Corynebacterium cystitidis DSM 20524 TaxID=1121357 RepID=A0A1H9TTH4_9CORY|nr:hypothetical protein CCYS_05085 [Corynebacterium cystitidis DSM 20524]SES00342.1 hypothetical protein SAMN05661109_01545 [Corynebacterium cystitidis DSM 20524]SNV81549.1 Uncharacterised protein [Corynebacterium cystitidis]
MILSASALSFQFADLIHLRLHALDIVAGKLAIGRYRCEARHHGIPKRPQRQRGPMGANWTS